MRKLLILLVLILVGVGAYYFGTRQQASLVLTSDESGYALAEVQGGQDIQFKPQGDIGDTDYWVHFVAGVSPCQNNAGPLHGKGKELAHCKTIKGKNVSFWFHFSNIKDDKTPDRPGRLLDAKSCPQCAGATGNPGPTGSKMQWDGGKVGSQQKDAPPILICDNPGPVSVDPNQQITWVIPGDRSKWSVDFGQSSPCGKQAVFTGGTDKDTCLISSDATPGKTYTYTATSTSSPVVCGPWTASITVNPAMSPTSAAR